MDIITNKPAVAARIAAIFASGTFFGLTVSTSTAIIPVLLDKQADLTSRDRLRYWVRQFDLCARRWTPISSSNMIFSLLSLYLTPSGSTAATRPLLWASFGSFFFQFALTFAFIFPVKDKLKAQLKAGEPFDDPAIRKNIKDWDSLHRLRIVGSAVAFGAGLIELVGYVARS
ncbi:hypothetical protein V8E36_008899 [Tilletia maclaganii]